MSNNESIPQRAINVLAQYATFLDDVDNDDPARHALRNLKSQIFGHLDSALSTAEGLLAMKDQLRELAPKPKAKP